jgi:translocation and assembly module TamB
MRRVLRITSWIAGSVLLAVVALVAALLIAGNTSSGRIWLEHVTARVTSGHVRISGLAGSFPAAINLQQLQLADARGTWLTAERVALHWSPLALLTRHVTVESLILGRLVIERAPVSAPSKKGSSTRLPHIDVARLSIDALELSPQLTGLRATLAVQGSAHLISLENAAARITARRTDGQGGDYELTLRFDPARMDASVKLDEPAGGALANLLHYPNLGALTLVANLSGQRSAEHVEVSARAGQLQAHAAGSLDLNHESADVAYSLNASAMAPRPDLSWQSIALQGRWQGTVSAPHASGRLEVVALQGSGGMGLAKLNADLTADGGDLAVHATAEGLVLPGPQPRLLADSPMRIDATVHLKDAARPLEVSADHRLFLLQARANTAGALSGSFDLRLRDLAPLAAIAHQSIRGTSEIKGTVKQSSATTRLDLDARTEVAQGAPLLATLLGGVSHLQLAASMTERSVNVEHLVLNARTLSLSVDGAAERGTTSAAPAVQSLRARYALNVTNIAALAPTLAGTLKVNGTLDGPIDSMATQLQMTSDLSVRGSPRETVQASIKARGLPARANATVQAQGRFSGAPVELDASVERGAGDTFHVTVQRADWKSAHLQGDLTTVANMTPGSGSVNLRIDRLADLQSLIGTSIAGSITGNLALKPVGSHTNAQLQLDAQNIVAPEFSGNAHLTASGPINDLSLQVAVQAPHFNGEPASIDAAAHLNVAAHELGLQQVQAHYRGQTLRLLAPARLSYADGLAINKLRLGAQRAVVSVDGRVAPALDLHASVHDLDASLVSAFVPGVLAAGSLDADAQLAGTSSAPSGLVTVKATGLRFAGSTVRDLHTVDLHATAHLKGNAAQLEVQLSAGNASQFTLTGNAPLGAEGALNLKLSGKLDAALANPILEARGQRAEGALTVDATVTGNPRAPEIGGTVDLAQGDVRDYTQGVHLSGITAHLVGDHGTLKIASLVAHAAPGQLSMTGTIGILQPKLPVDLQLTAQNAQPIASDILTANLNADLKVKGTLRERIDVSGTIDLKRTVIGIPNALPPDVAVLDVRRPGQAPPAPAESKLLIALDINLHAPRDLVVQGRGMNAELGGDVHFGGSTDNLVGSGSFDLIRGTFALASSTLTFTDGRVSFNGTGLKHKIDPTLDFTAKTTAADATATLHITGYADAPQFDLSSTPPLPQDEILARLLFGESASQLTVLQVAQIGAAVATLGGVGGSGPNPLAKVQKALGLDRLSVGGGTSTGAAGQTSGAAVEAGRYVSNRVFVGAKQSTTGFTQVEVDVDLTKRLKLQTRLGNGTATTQGTTPENDPGSTVGLMYQFEY